MRADQQPCRRSVNLILLEPSEVSAAGIVTLSGPRAAHMLNVLHVAPGHDVRIGVLDGPRGIATVDAIGNGIVTLRCLLEPDVPARPAVDLLLATPRPKVMRRLWAQIAALGVGRIILTNAEKVERHYFDTHMLEAGTYRPLLIEGLQQARDTRLPSVSIHRRFRVLIEDELDELVGPAFRVVTDPSATTSVTEIVRASRESRILLAIGPEGGWNRFELDLLAAHGFQSAGMGPRTLRTDTACVALLALAHQERAEMAHQSTINLKSDF
jgi:16S rRNA (uracil1498-N3)-methyltransferase